jgi:putative ABC transport system substrate-binding protein
MIAPRRRTAALAAGAIIGPAGVRAQPAGRVFQIGYVGNSTSDLETALVAAFREGLRERGYTEGKNLVIHFRWAEGMIDVFPSIVADLIGLKVDVLVTSGTPATLAAKKATMTIPIVMAAQGDAVAAGIVSNLARPGSNITGISTLYPDAEGKRLGILRELVPRLERLALLRNPANPFSEVILKAAQSAARLLRISTQVFEVREAGEFERVFAAIARTRPDAMDVLADRPFFFTNRMRIVRFAEQNRLPTIHPYLEDVEEGGLVFYGPNFSEMFRHAGVFIDKIFKGAKPGDLPIEQPTKFELVINLKTAKALGLTVPQSVLLRADKVIQ